MNHFDEADNINQNNVRMSATAQAICPTHGEQEGMEFAAGPAPCGCQFVWERYETCDRLIAQSHREPDWDAITGPNGVL